MLLAYMMVIHFVADFLLQSREMGKKKSYEFKWLGRHLSIQYTAFAICLMPFVGFHTALIFAALNALIHGIIDWHIWRLYKLSAHKRILKEVDALRDSYLDTNDIEKWDKAQYDIKVKNWQYWEDHWFYSTIGLDQLLHCITIIALFNILL